MAEVTRSQQGATKTFATPPKPARPNQNSNSNKPAEMREFADKVRQIQSNLKQDKKNRLLYAHGAIKRTMAGYLARKFISDTKKMISLLPQETANIQKTPALQQMEKSMPLPVRLSLQELVSKDNDIPNSTQDTFDCFDSLEQLNSEISSRDSQSQKNKPFTNEEECEIQQIVDLFNSIGERNVLIATRVLQGYLKA